MKSTSLDGKTRKPSASSLKSPPLRINTDNLRPASPPKRNPWAQLTPPRTARNEGFPSLTLLPEGSGRGTEDAGNEDPKTSNSAPGRHDLAEVPGGDGEYLSSASAGSSKCQRRDQGCQTPLSFDGRKLQTTPTRPLSSDSSSKRSSDGETQTNRDEESVRAPSPAALERKGKGKVDEKGKGRKEVGVVNGKVKNSQSNAQPASPSSHSNTSGPTFASKGSPDQGKDHASDTVSNCSSGSRKVFEAAAARASENLWNYGVGADVHVHAESMIYAVHRQLVMKQSAWLRHAMPPPNEDGSVVHIYLPFAAGAVGPCLSYMYTHRIDVVERTGQSLNAAHLPRCVLGYCAAVTLQMSNLTSHILRIVESTAADFTNHFSTHYVNQNIDPQQGQALIFHLFNAFRIIHGESCYALVRPMRLALAGVLDGILPCLVRQDTLFYMLALPEWKEHGPAISADMMEYRMLANYPKSYGGAIPTSEEQIDALFERNWAEANAGGDASLSKSHETLKPMRRPDSDDGEEIEIRPA